jgi:hypothetical protein
MSLVLAWVNEKFIAVSCDGKMVRKHPDGTVTPAGEHRGKFHLLTEDVVIASTGSAELPRWLSRTLDPFVKQHLDDPDLFRCLEISVPRYARQFCALRHSAVPQEHTVLLFGYDAAAQRLRGVGWDSNTDFTPVQIGPGNIVIAGWEEGKHLADRRVDELQLLTRRAPNPQDARSVLEGIVREVGSLVPERVNTNAQSYVMVPPAVKGEWRAKGLSEIRFANPASTEGPSADPAYADGNGNLLLKNKTIVSLSSNATTTTSTFSDTGLTLTITTKGNKVLVLFTGIANTQGVNPSTVLFKVQRDGIDIGPLAAVTSRGNADQYSTAISYVDNPSAGSHTYKVQMALTFVSAGLTGLLELGASLQLVELG